MIIDQTGQHEVLLLINHTYNKICDILGFFKIKTQEILRVFSQQLKKGPPKKPLSAGERWRVLSHYTVLLVLKSGQLIANQIWEFSYSYD